MRTGLRSLLLAAFVAVMAMPSLVQAETSTGCVDVMVESYSSTGQPISTNEPFSFRLDNGNTISTSYRGRFTNVSTGMHTVSQQGKSGWRLLTSTPVDGRVSVAAGSDCAAVVYKYAQTGGGSYSSHGYSSYSSQSHGGNGCIDILSEAYEQNGNQIAPDRFTYRLDDGRTMTTDSSGITRFNNVSIGRHTVNQLGMNGWDLLSVTPSAGSINVIDSGTCVAMTFKSIRRQGPPPPPQPQPGRLNLMKVADRLEVLPNQEIFYTITIRNDSSAVVTNIEADDMHDFTWSRLVDAGGAQQIGDRLVWNIGTLQPGQVRTLHYRVRVLDTAPHGVMVRDVVIVRSSAGVLTDDAIVRVIRGLPQTGVDLSSLTSLAPVTAGGGLPLAALLSMAVTGLGSGIAASRRWIA